MIPILRNEKQFLVVNKPAGLLTQSTGAVPSLERELVQQLKLAEQHPGKPFVGLPHRLDRETSGIMLIARNQRALKRFGQQFQSRKIGKYYLAVLRGTGNLPSGSQTWQDWIRKVPDEARAEITADGAAEGRVAELDALHVLSVGALNLMLIRLITGRMHQIRVQAATRGWPVLGDSKYGCTEQFVPAQFVPAQFVPAQFVPADDGGNSGERSLHIALHAMRIEFRHPQSGLLQSGTADVSEHWRQLPADLLDKVAELTRASREEMNVSWNDRF